MRTQRSLATLALALILSGAPAIASAGSVYNVYVNQGFRGVGLMPLGGVIPVVLAGTIPEGLEPAQFTDMLRSPGYAPPTRFVPSGTGYDNGTRMVFSFGNASPRGLCDEPRSGGASDVISVAFCTGDTTISLATLRRGSNLQGDLNQVMREIISRPRALGGLI
ncbi:MAG: hypothetical protein AAGE18_13475 [Pseudomonadota bacterium]